MISLAGNAGVSILASSANSIASLASTFVVPETVKTSSALGLIFTDTATFGTFSADTFLREVFGFASGTFGLRSTDLAVVTASSAFFLFHEPSVFATSTFVWFTSETVGVAAGFAGVTILAGSALVSACSTDTVLVPEAIFTFSALISSITSEAVFSTFSTFSFINEELLFTGSACIDRAGCAVLFLAG